MTISTGFLGRMHSASEFAEFGNSSIGDGVTNYLNQLQVISNNSMTVTVKTGFALANGYYLLSNEDFDLVIPDANPSQPRYDAVIVRVDYETRAAELAVAKGEAAASPVKYTPVRDSHIYEIILANLYVRAEATQVLTSDIEDTRNNPSLCGRITLQPEFQQKLNQLNGVNLQAVNQKMLQNNSEANRLVEYAQDEMADMVEDVESILTPIMPAIGRINWSIADLTLRSQYLLCDGSVIPAQYTELIEYLGTNTTPDLCNSTDLVKAYICAVATI